MLINSKHCRLREFRFHFTFEINIHCRIRDRNVNVLIMGGRVQIECPAYRHAHNAFLPAMAPQGLVDIVAFPPWNGRGIDSKFQ